MQGFIIHLQRVKDEDLIITIVTQHRLETLYRFYGARHGTINLGYLIDFGIEHSLKSSIGRLFDVVHLGYPWLLDSNRTRIWQQFIGLFYPHLREAEETGDFYFELLRSCAEQWEKQNPRRIAVEAYIRLLQHEGRTPDRDTCFFCEQQISEAQVGVIRSFQYAHPHCTHFSTIDKKAMDHLLESRSSLLLDDREVEALWVTLSEGF